MLYVNIFILRTNFQSLLNQKKNEIVSSAYYISTQKPLNETRLSQFKSNIFYENFNENYSFLLTEKQNKQFKWIR